MKKSIKKILSISLLTGMLFSSSSAFAEDPISNSPKTTTNMINIMRFGTYTDDFDIGSYGSDSWRFSNSPGGNGSFTFDERVKGIKITFTDTTNNKVLYTEELINKGPLDENGNEQGIKKITFSMDMIESHNYKLTLKNLDNEIISGTLKVTY